MSPVVLLVIFIFILSLIAVFALFALWFEMRRAEKLRGAIRKHRDAVGHERCWENDLELYRVLDEPLPDRLALTEEEFLGGCREYYQGQTR